MNLAYIPSPTFSKFEIGPFTIHMYAICILIGICVAVWILATRWKRYGGTFDQILDTTLVTVPCALVGARLYHCITTPADYFPPTGNLVNILKVWEGGMAIFGGISVGTLVAFLCHKHDILRKPHGIQKSLSAPGLCEAVFFYLRHRVCILRLHGSYYHILKSLSFSCLSLSACDNLRYSGLWSAAFSALPCS